MPTAATRPKSARTTLRASLEGKALIKHAAAIADATVPGFILQNACEPASRVVAGNGQLLLSQSVHGASMDAVEGANGCNLDG